MEHVIVFDKYTSVFAETDQWYNELFVKQKVVFIKDLLKFRGYVYLNQVYEMLGVKWNPEEENICYIYDEKTPVEFRFFIDGKRFDLIIEW